MQLQSKIVSSHLPLGWVQPQVDAFREDIEEVAQGVGEEVEKHAGEVVGRACDLLDEFVESKWVGDVLSQRIEEAQASLTRESSRSEAEYNGAEGEVFGGWRALVLLC
jgi:hypothetical protein